MRLRTIRRAAVTIAGALTWLEVTALLERRHEELIDRLDELTADRDALAELLADARSQPATPPTATTAPARELYVGLVWAPNGTVVKVDPTGARSALKAPAAKWAALANVARRTTGMDVDGIEARLLAESPGVKEVRFLPPARLENACRRLLNLLAETPA